MGPLKHRRTSQRWPLPQSGPHPQGQQGKRRRTSREPEPTGGWASGKAPGTICQQVKVSGARPTPHAGPILHRLTGAVRKQNRAPEARPLGPQTCQQGSSNRHNGADGDLTDWTSAIRELGREWESVGPAHSEAAAGYFLKAGAGTVCTEGLPARQGTDAALGGAGMCRLPRARAWVSGEQRATPEVSPVGLPTVKSTGLCRFQNTDAHAREPHSALKEKGRQKACHATVPRYKKGKVWYVQIAF